MYLYKRINIYYIYNNMDKSMEIYLFRDKYFLFLCMFFKMLEMITR